MRSDGDAKLFATMNARVGAWWTKLGTSAALEYDPSGYVIHSTSYG